MRKPSTPSFRMGKEWNNWTKDIILLNLFPPCLNLSTDRKRSYVGGCWEQYQFGRACTHSCNSAFSKWMKTSKSQLLPGKGKSWTVHPTFQLFWGLPKGLTCVLPVTEHFQDLAYSRCLRGAENRGERCGYRRNVSKHNKAWIWQVLSYHTQWWKAESLSSKIGNKVKMLTLIHHSYSTWYWKF